MEVMMLGEGCDDRTIQKVEVSVIQTLLAKQGGGTIGKWESYRDIIMFMVPFAYTFLYPFISTP